MHSGMIGKIIRRISEWEGAGEADLLSYILFDGDFSARLIELGRNDARARHAEGAEMLEVTDLLVEGDVVLIGSPDRLRALARGAELGMERVRDRRAAVAGRRILDLSEPVRGARGQQFRRRSDHGPRRGVHNRGARRRGRVRFSILAYFGTDDGAALAAIPPTRVDTLK